MKWNWQKSNWPQFEYDPAALKALEETFIVESAKLLGASEIITDEQQQRFTIDLLSEEALKSSDIEGEVLRRDSVAASLIRAFGFKLGDQLIRANDKEAGIAAVMRDNYQSFAAPLNHEKLFEWHPCIVTKSLLVRDVGIYRTSKEPMQVVSGRIGNEVIHYEAPSSDRVQGEMDTFIGWFNDTAPGNGNPLPALTRAALAHLWFESIHPFDDGNGRIGRAIAEKSLAQSIGRPGLFALSHIIERNRSEYYEELEKSQTTLQVDAWLHYFAHTVLDATAYSRKLVRFIVAKTRLLDGVRDQINERQEKALLRMFAEGLDGFTGGMSAKKYMATTGAAVATASRDLNGLVELGALTRTGQLKSTRYWLNLADEFGALNE